MIAAASSAWQYTSKVLKSTAAVLFGWSTLGGCSWVPQACRCATQASEAQPGAALAGEGEVCLIFERISGPFPPTVAHRLF